MLNKYAPKMLYNVAGKCHDFHDFNIGGKMRV